MTGSFNLIAGHDRQLLAEGDGARGILNANCCTSEAGESDWSKLEAGLKCHRLLLTSNCLLSPAETCQVLLGPAKSG